MKTLLSIGTLIDESWAYYRKNFHGFMNISGWFLITGILNTVALLLYPSSRVLAFHSYLTGYETFAVILCAITSLVLTPLLGFWIYVTLTRATFRSIKNQDFQKKTFFLETKLYFVPAIIVTILVGLMLVWAQIITIGPAIIIGIIGSFVNNTPLVVLANIALVIGLFVSIYLTSKWSVYFYMAPTSNILDGAQKKSALQKSRSLIEGRFWNVLLRVIVPKLVFVAFTMFAFMIISLILKFTISTFVGLNMDLQDRLLSIVNLLIPILSTILIYPLFILSDVLLYQSLKGETTPSTQISV